MSNTSFVYLQRIVKDHLSCGYSHCAAKQHQSRKTHSKRFNYKFFKILAAFGTKASVLQKTLHVLQELRDQQYSRRLTAYDTKDQSCRRPCMWNKSISLAVDFWRVLQQHRSISSVSLWSPVLSSLRIPY